MPSEVSSVESLIQAIIDAADLLMPWWETAVTVSLVIALGVALVSRAVSWFARS